MEPGVYLFHRHPLTVVGPIDLTVMIALNEQKGMRVIARGARLTVMVTVVTRNGVRMAVTKSVYAVAMSFVILAHYFLVKTARSPNCISKSLAVNAL
jgi:hypothetical protein